MRLWWRLWRKSLHCPHARLLGIYGDMINHVAGFRLACADCGSYLDGPVSLAQQRPL